MNAVKKANAAVVAKLQAGERLTRGGRALPAAFLEEMVDLARRYAEAERIVLGAPQVKYSPVSLEADLDAGGDVVQQAEKLAEAERARHQLPVGPVLEIAAFLEDQGIKIIGRRFPEDVTSLGAFFFDGDIGPTIVLNTGVTPADEAYVLARHFGHFLADYEPYPYVVCGRPDPQDFTDPVEVRAHAFALAFLMPQHDIDMYREAMGLQRDQVLLPEFLEQLQVYFEVDVELLLWRFLGLGWIDAAQLETFLEQEPRVAAALHGGLQHTVSDEADGADELPDRFVQLVARAFGDKKLDIETAARLLGVEEVEAARLLSQFRYDTVSKPDSKPNARSHPDSLPPRDTLH